jgi:hypothetical protein
MEFLERFPRGVGATNRGVIDVQSSLAHHLLQIPLAELDTGGTSGHRANNLGLKVTPFERGRSVHEIGSSRFSEHHRVYCILAIFATQPSQRE